MMMMKTILVWAFVLAYVSSCWAYSKVGCFNDKKQRILEGKFTKATDMTIEKCVQICSLEGDYFAGVEYGSQCYCGKNLKQYSQVAESECSYDCQGDNSQKCGGFWKISVYTTNVNYLGCYEDKSDRILEDRLTTNSAMTTKMCIQTCQNKGKRFAITESIAHWGMQPLVILERFLLLHSWYYYDGKLDKVVEEKLFPNRENRPAGKYSSQCICGNHLKPYTKKPESDCSYACAGNANEKCGGYWRGSLYLINYNEM